MNATPILTAAVFLVLGACAKPMEVTGRADNDVLRFSAKNYSAHSEILVQ